MASITFDDIKRLLEEIKTKMEDILLGLPIHPNQIQVYSGLSEIDERLGLVTAGEFRTGNGQEPGDGFTGVRMAYPAMTYDGNDYHLAGVNDDVIQFGADATGGSMIAGAGAVKLDSDGLTVYVDSTAEGRVEDREKINIKDLNTGADLLQLIGWRPGPDTYGAIRYGTLFSISKIAGELPILGMSGNSIALSAGTDSNDYVYLYVDGDNKKIEIESFDEGLAGTTSVTIDGNEVLTAADSRLTFEIELNRATALAVTDKAYRRIPAFANGWVLKSAAAMVKNPSSLTGIDVGAAATNRASQFDTATTYILLDNPANSGGTITDIEIWCSVNATGAKVGTFIKDGDKFTPRDYETLGNITAGSKQTFSGLSITVVVGDYIGFYLATGQLEADQSGSGIYRKVGDQFAAGQQTYANIDSRVGSLWGYGAAPVTLTVKNGATSMLNFGIYIDAGETDSSTAGISATVDTGNDDVATTDQIEVAVENPGSGVTYCEAELVFGPE